MNKIKGLHFQPWIGPNYGTANYGKLLLLGESHYFDNSDDDTFNLTSEVVMNHIDGTGRCPFFKKAGYAFDINDWRRVWNNVAYANLIQVGLNNARSQPNTEERLKVNDSFDLLLNSLMPEKVIVLSKRMWTEWLTEGSCRYLSFIKENDKSSEIWEYDYVGGKCLVMGTYHPSSMRFVSKEYYPLIHKFLSLKW